MKIDIVAKLTQDELFNILAAALGSQPTDLIRRGDLWEVVLESNPVGDTVSSVDPSALGLSEVCTACHQNRPLAGKTRCYFCSNSDAGTIDPSPT
jgi:hypothetical protein